MTRSERMLRVNRERDRRMVANALKWHPAEGQHALAGDWERQRVAIAERLRAIAKASREFPWTSVKEREAR